MQQAPVTPTPMNPPVKKLSKGFYLGSYIGSIVAIFILGIILLIGLVVPAIITTSSGEGADFGTAGIATLGFAIVTGILLFFVGVYFVVINMILLYKAWQAIQDGSQSTTPGMAVGFMFIPLFNYYWWFRSIWGFAKDYNAFAVRHGLAVKKLSESLFLTAAILNVVDIVFRGLAGFANYIICGVLVSQTVDAVNALAQ